MHRYQILSAENKKGLAGLLDSLEGGLKDGCFENSQLFAG